MPRPNLRTTIATNLAVAAATAGRKLLLIDTDPQASSIRFAANGDGNRPQFRTV